MLVSRITSLLFFLYTPVISVSPTISSALLGELLPIPTCALPPPTKYKLLLALALSPICVIGSVATADLTRRLLETKVVVDIPLLAVINWVTLIAVVVIPEAASNAPDILVSPATSRATVGELLPIPTLAFPPPDIYMLLAASTFVPYWAIGIVAVVVFAMIVPVEVIDDAVIPLLAVISPDAVILLLAVISPDAIIEVVSSPPTVFINPLNSSVVPVIADVAFIVVADIPAAAFIIPSDVIVDAVSPALAVINPEEVIVEPDIIPPFVFTAFVVFMVVACIPLAAVINPDAEIVVAVMPPDATTCFPKGTVMPPLAVINSPARIVVVDAMLFADIAADALIVFADTVPDMLAAPRTSRATVGDELPIPILAVLPPIKYRLFAALVLVPYWTIGAVAVVDRTRSVPDVSIVVVMIPPFAINDFPVGIVSPLLALIKPEAVIVVAEMPPLAVSRHPADIMNPFPPDTTSP